MQMVCNVGGNDRIARLGIGSGLLAVGMLVPMNRWLRLGTEVLGVVGLATGLSRYCPMSQAMGRNTCVRVEPGASEAAGRGE